MFKRHSSLAQMTVVAETLAVMTTSAIQFFALGIQQFLHLVVYPAIRRDDDRHVRAHLLHRL